MPVTDFRSFGFVEAFEVTHTVELHLHPRAFRIEIRRAIANEALGYVPAFYVEVDGIWRRLHDVRLPEGAQYDDAVNRAMAALKNWIVATGG
ncbi:hypothetical protein BH09MYX1_BH09MYX1_61600 [soil metagenome]